MDRDVVGRSASGGGGRASPVDHNNNWCGTSVGGRRGEGDGRPGHPSETKNLRPADAALPFPYPIIGRSATIYCVAHPVRCRRRNNDHEKKMGKKNWSCDDCRMRRIAKRLSTGRTRGFIKIRLFGIVKIIINNNNITCARALLSTNRQGRWQTMTTCFTPTLRAPPTDLGPLSLKI